MWGKNRQNCCWSNMTAEVKTDLQTKSWTSFSLTKELNRSKSQTPQDVPATILILAEHLCSPNFRDSRRAGMSLCLEFVFLQSLYPCFLLSPVQDSDISTPSPALSPWANMLEGFIQEVLRVLCSHFDAASIWIQVSPRAAPWWWFCFRLSELKHLSLSCFPEEASFLMKQPLRMHPKGWAEVKSWAKCEFFCQRRHKAISVGALLRHEVWSDSAPRRCSRSATKAGLLPSVMWRKRKSWRVLAGIFHCFHLSESAPFVNLCYQGSEDADVWVWGRCDQILCSISTLW